MGIFLLIHESHIAEHGEIRYTSSIASSRPIGLVTLDPRIMYLSYSMLYHI